MCLIALLGILIAIERYSGKFGSTRLKLQHFLFWNGSIRLFTEAYLNLTLFSLLNMEEVAWPPGQDAVTISNYFAYIFLGLCFVIPIVLAVFFCRTQDAWATSSFKLKYGTYLEGTRHYKEGYQGIVMFLALTFFMRRMVLSLCLVYCQSFFWAQVAAQFQISIFMIIVLQWARPHESRSSTWTETGNEFMTLIILYHMVCYSDFVLNPWTKSVLGTS